MQKTGVVCTPYPTPEVFVFLSETAYSRIILGMKIRVQKVKIFFRLLHSNFYLPYANRSARRSGKPAARIFFCAVAISYSNRRNSIVPSFMS